MREADSLTGGANLVLARDIIESTMNIIRDPPRPRSRVGPLADLQQILWALVDARVSHMLKLFFCPSVR
jgi:hypothetical protein